jgi:hypothetical protein
VHLAGVILRSAFCILHFAFSGKNPGDTVQLEVQDKKFVMAGELQVMP